MAYRVSKLAIGSFVAASVVIAIILVMFFGGRKLFEPREEYVLFFDGSVSGLDPGAPVTFQGVKVGSVHDIKINVYHTNGADQIVTPVFIEIYPDNMSVINGEIGADFINRLIKHGLRGQLQLQSFLTGKLYVELGVFPGSAAKYRHLIKKVPEIPTIPTALQEISHSLSNLQLQQLVADARRAVTGIADLINNGKLDKTLGHLQQTSANLEALTGKLNNQAGDTLANINRFLEQYSQLADALNSHLPAVSDQLQKTLAQAQTSMAALQSTGKDLQYSLSEDSPLYQQLQASLKELQDASRSVHDLTDSLSRHPESLLKGKR